MKNLFTGRTDNTYLQLFRSTQSSLIAFLADFVLYLLLSQILSVHYLIARVISYIFGMTISYFLSVKWIFKTRKVTNRFLEYGGFAAVGMIGAIENIALMVLFKEIAGFHHIFANISAGLIVFFFNFFGRKFLLFRKTNKD